MSAGQLRHRVVLEQRTQMPSEAGHLVDTFAEVAEVWGGVEAVRGSVYAAGLQTDDRITHRITLRWRLPGDFDHIRELDTGHRYKVRDARDPDGRRRFLEIMSEETNAP